MQTTNLHSKIFLHLLQFEKCYIFWRYNFWSLTVFKINLQNPICIASKFILAFTHYIIILHTCWISCSPNFQDRHFYALFWYQAIIFEKTLVYGINIFYIVVRNSVISKPCIIGHIPCSHFLHCNYTQIKLLIQQSQYDPLTVIAYQ